MSRVISPARALRTAAIAVTVGAVGVVGLLAVPAGAASNPTASTKVLVTASSIRSISVDLSTLALGECTNTNSTGLVSTGDTLTFPHGECISPTPVTITNGPVGGHVDVAATNATSDPGTTPWTVCPITGCNTPGVPGPNQFELWTEPTPNNPGKARNPVSDRTECDLAFDGVPTATTNQSCVAGPAQQQKEFLLFEGPSISTSPNSNWNFTVTWTATP